MIDSYRRGARRQLPSLDHPLVLSDRDVETLLPPRAAVRVTESAFRAVALGSVSQVSSFLGDPTTGRLAVKAALSEKLNLASVKLNVLRVAHQRVRIRGVVVLLQANTGAVRALICSESLTSIRTGAVAGLSARYLARPDATRLAVIGSGRVAWFAALSVSTVRRLRSIAVYSRTEQRRARFARLLQSATGIPVAATESAEHAVFDADICVTATTSRSPVFEAEAVADDCHVVALGSFSPQHSEIDASLLSRARIFVDNLTSLQEAGELRALPSHTTVESLADVVIGRSSGWLDTHKLSIFKSVGLPAQDLYAANAVYRSVLRSNRATRSSRPRG